MSALACLTGVWLLAGGPLFPSTCFPFGRTSLSMWALYLDTEEPRLLYVTFDWRLFKTWASLVAQRLKRLPAMQETWVRSTGSGRSPGEGNGNPLQYSCLENPMDGGAWRATVHGVAKSWTWLSDFTFTFLRPRPASYSAICLYSSDPSQDHPTYSRWKNRLQVLTEESKHALGKCMQPGRDCGSHLWNIVRTVIR